MAQSRVFYIKVIIDGADHNFAGIHADADMQPQFFRLAKGSAVVPHRLLHRQSRIACAQRVIFVR